MKKKLLSFKSHGAKDTDDGKCADHGDIGSLHYELYQRGSQFTVLHVFDDNGLRFKKDITAFQAELDKIDFVAMTDGEQKDIKGSGDNDDFIVTKTNGEIELSLKRRGYDVIEKLKDILQGKGVKNGN